MTKAGQIKKTKTIFNTVRMKRRGDGQERDALPLGGRIAALTTAIYDEFGGFDKQVNPRFVMREIPDFTRPAELRQWRKKAKNR